MSSHRSYETVAAEFDEVARDFDLFALAAQKGPSYVASRMPAQRCRALDIGCGTGRTVVELAPHFQEVYGIDISKGMLKVADERYTEASLTNVSLRKMNAIRLNFPSEHFDFVTAHTMLHHVHNLCSVLEEMKRVLKPGGRIVIVDILREGLTGKWPAGSTRMLAGINLLMDIFRIGLRNALDRYRRRTSDAWMTHQRGEQFIVTPDAWTAILPGVTINTKLREFGFTRYVFVEWDKDAKDVFSEVVSGRSKHSAMPRLRYLEKKWPTARKLAIRVLSLGMWTVKHQSATASASTMTVGSGVDYAGDMAEG